MIEIAKLEKTFEAEVAADKWWSSLSDKEKKAYIKAHPRSKYAKKRASASSGEDRLGNDLKKLGLGKTKRKKPDSDIKGHHTVSHYATKKMPTMSDVGNVLKKHGFKRSDASDRYHRYTKGKDFVNVHSEGQLTPRGDGGVAQQVHRFHTKDPRTGEAAA